MNETLNHLTQKSVEKKPIIFDTNNQVHNILHPEIVTKISLDEAKIISNWILEENKIHKHMIEKTPEQIAAEEEQAKKDAEAMAEDAQPTDAPDEEKVMLLEENAKLKQQVAELETKLATNEADKVKDEAELETMKKEIADVKADFEKFKNETPASQPISNLPQETVKAFEDMTPVEKFRF